MRWCAVFVVPLVAGALLPACGAPASACGPAERIIEPTQGHVLPGFHVDYLHHPPTSGRHIQDPPAVGVHARPIDEERQVAALERGWVLLQYSSRASRDDRRNLLEVADARLKGQPGRGDVVVAPAVRIDDGRRIALTAWDYRQLCSHASVSAAARFVVRFAGLPVG